MKEWVGLLVFVAGCGGIAYNTREELAKTFVYESSPVDWCETNFEHHPWVAEWYNTWSSFSMCVVGLTMGRFLGAGVKAHEPKLWMIFVLLFIVGIGSAVFHGTLSIAGQVFDELPISLMSLFGAFMLRPLKKWNMTVRGVVFTPVFFIALTVFSTLASLLVPAMSHVFVLAFLPITVVSFVSEYRDSSDAVQQQAKKPFAVALFFVFIAFGGWLIDRFLCVQLQSFLGFNPQLHAWWHFNISICFWACTVTGVILRAGGDNVKTQIQTRFLLPPTLVVVKDDE